MQNFRYLLKSSLMLVSAPLLMAAANPQTAELDADDLAAVVTGEHAYRHVEYLSEVIGARVAGTWEEQRAGAYVRRQLEEMDYEVMIQPFTFTDESGETFHSANIIAIKPGRRDRTVIVGAHYDSVAVTTCDDGSVLTGAGDNASGVGVMLEVAKAMERRSSRGRVVFVAFGGEEYDRFAGSNYFVSQMSERDLADTVAMINLDSVGVGDYFYVYAGLDGNPGWVRDRALAIGQRLGYDLRTSPQSEFYEWGTTGDWSDHIAFRLQGIPVAYFEWMNWDIEPDGGIETEAYGWIMHTCLDNLSFVDPAKLELTASVVTRLVRELGRRRPCKRHDDGCARAAAGSMGAFGIVEAEK